MSRSYAFAASVVTGMFLAGCAGRARPHALDDLAGVRSSPQARESEALAPASFADAERYRREAEGANAAGRPAVAQALAERALAAYTRAFANARSARAERARGSTAASLDAAERELHTLADAQARVETEVRDLETRTHVIRDAMPVTASGPADPARERARLEAARSLAAEARLLCMSARLVGASGDALQIADTTLAELAKALESTRGPAPIDLATRARTGCLAALTQARRGARNAASDDASDALLADLSREGSFAPARDDRGVFVTVRDAFAGDGLSAAAEARLAAVADVAAAHAKMPLLVVVHGAPAAGSQAGEREARRAAALKKVLRRGDSIAVEFVGASRPVVDPTNTRDRSRNERVEIVFVDVGA